MRVKRCGLVVGGSFTPTGGLLVNQNGKWNQISASVAKTAWGQAAAESNERKPGLRCQRLPTWASTTKYLAVWEWEANIRGLEIFDLLPVENSLIIRQSFHFLITSLFTDTMCMFVVFFIRERLLFYYDHTIVNDIFIMFLLQLKKYVDRIVFQAKYSY